jgi:hypothetical protein
VAPATFSTRRGPAIAVRPVGAGRAVKRPGRRASHRAEAGPWIVWVMDGDEPVFG